MEKQVGLSPKVIAAALTFVVGFLITKLGLQWDPVFEQAINGIAAVVAAFLAPPGVVVKSPNINPPV